MISRHYKDFHDCYINFNKEVLLNPDLGTLNSSLYLDDIHIEIDSYNADKLDLSLIGYKKGKWPHLLRSYVDMDELKDFYEGLKTISGTTYAFSFKSKKSGNGGCIKNVVFTRVKNRWTGCHVFWRTIQLENKFMADLMMINRVIEAAPNTDIQKVFFHIPQAFQSSVYAIYFMEHLYGISFKDIEDKLKYNETASKKQKVKNYKYWEHILSHKKWTDPSHRLCLRATTARYQKFIFDIKAGKMPTPVTKKDCQLPLK